jgi:hypothetical protein
MREAGATIHIGRTRGVRRSARLWRPLLRALR